MAARDFLSDKDKADILVAISDAESRTSGEIRLHVESRCKVDVMDRAATVFATLDMHKTELRNVCCSTSLPRTGSSPSLATAASTPLCPRGSGTGSRTP